MAEAKPSDNFDAEPHGPAWDGRDEINYPDDDDEVDEDDENERAIQECGQMPQLSGCQLAGTEYCDFECPYRDMNLFSDPDEESDDR